MIFFFFGRMCVCVYIFFIVVHSLFRGKKSEKKMFIAMHNYTHSSENISETWPEIFVRWKWKRNAEIVSLVLFIYDTAKM